MGDNPIQRRLAAVLAADIAGYTRQMEQDTDGTVTAWREARLDVIDPKITEFGGRIVKHTGDGFLAEFDAVTSAVNCAVVIQEALRDNTLEFRMGVHLGEVIEELDDIHGEGVNLAARLEALAEPGCICVSGDVYNQVRNRLDHVFEDMGEKEVKNVSAPIRVYAIRVGTKMERQNIDPNRRAKLSIAVLPFDNLSGDPEQEYFSDGMAEDLITDLSKIDGLFVAARNSSFFFKGQMPDVREVASKLSVTFVLEGSVRKMGNRLRINAQLIKAQDGGHVWAERYDGNLDEIFDFQDRIRDEIIAALRLTLSPDDEERREKNRATSVAAYDLYLKGRASYYHYSPERILMAEDYLTQAIEADPNLAEAYAYLSRCISGSWIHMWPGHDETLDRAIELAEKAVSLDGTSALGYTMLAWAQTFSRQFDQSDTNFQRAISLDPNNPDVWITYASAMSFWGNPESTLAMIDRVFEIEPLGHPNADFVIGQCDYELCKLDDALKMLAKVTERSPGFIAAPLYMAAAYAEMDRLDEARIVIKRLLKQWRYSIADAKRIYPYRHEKDRERFIKALRLAELPED